MIKTAIPASHNGLLTYGAGSPVYGTGNPSCGFLGVTGGPGCAIDLTKWKDWVGVQGTSETVTNVGDSILWSSRGIKDFAIGGDKIAKLLPFIVLMLAFGLAIGWSKGRNYFK